MRNIKQICATKTNAVLDTFDPQGEAQGARSLPAASNTKFSMQTPLASAASAFIVHYACVCVCVCVVVVVVCVGVCGCGCVWVGVGMCWVGGVDCVWGWLVYDLLCLLLVIVCASRGCSLGLVCEVFLGYSFIVSCWYF